MTSPERVLSVTARFRGKIRITIGEAVNMMRCYHKRGSDNNISNQSSNCSICFQSMLVLIKSIKEILGTNLSQSSNNSDQQSQSITQSSDHPSKAQYSEPLNIKMQLIQAIKANSFERFKSVLDSHPDFPVDFTETPRNNFLLSKLRGQSQVGPFRSVSRFPTVPLRTLLHHIAMNVKSNDCFKFVKELINRKADINAKDASNLTPLHLAVGFNNKFATEVLFDLNADDKVVDSFQMNIWHLCCQNDNLQEFIDLVKIFIKHYQKSHPDFKTNQSLENDWYLKPLDPSIVPLFANSIRLNAVDENLNRPIHIVAYYGNNSLIRLLLRFEVERNCYNRTSVTPLSMAFELYRKLYTNYLNAERGNASQADFIVCLHANNSNRTENFDKTPVDLHLNSPAPKARCVQLIENLILLAGPIENFDNCWKICTDANVRNFLINHYGALNLIEHYLNKFHNERESHSQCATRNDVLTHLGKMWLKKPKSEQLPSEFILKLIYQMLLQECSIKVLRTFNKLLITKMIGSLSNDFMIDMFHLVAQGIRICLFGHLPQVDYCINFLQNTTLIFLQLIVGRKEKLNNVRTIQIVNILSPLWNLLDFAMIDIDTHGSLEGGERFAVAIQSYYLTSQIFNFDIPQNNTEDLFSEWAHKQITDREEQLNRLDRYLLNPRSIEYQSMLDPIRKFKSLPRQNSFDKWFNENIKDRSGLKSSKGLKFQLQEVISCEKLTGITV